MTYDHLLTDDAIEARKYTASVLRLLASHADECEECRQQLEARLCELRSLASDADVPAEVRADVTRALSEFWNA